MRREEQRFEVLVVGAGPAGMAAAARAGEFGVRVGLVDDNAKPGGQIWRNDLHSGNRDLENQDSHNKDAAQWAERVRTSGAIILGGVRIFDQPEPGILLGEGTDVVHELAHKKLVIATGARERFLPFPGWTLPNVMGAGGLQAMVKCGLPIRGKHVLVAGTGPLLLAVAAYLRKHGAEVPMICEQASWKSLSRFGAALWRNPAKAVQGLRLRKDLGPTPLVANAWPIAAHGREVLESVTVLRSGKQEAISCDYLACGFHLVPNLELPLLLGCRVQNECVWVDDFQRTSVANVFCAGEPTGIGGVELALVEGEIAGLVAGERSAQAQKLFRRRDKYRRFSGALDRAFRLRPELQSLPHPETVVCRCEDVTYSRLRPYTSWRAAKLHTRCGMGPCQGRVCGPATQFLLQWHPDSVRPPIFPTRLESLATVAGHSDP